MRTAFEPEGDVRSVDLPAAFASLWRERASGTLRFSRTGHSVRFEIVGGDVVGVHSSDPAYQTAEVLIRAGKLDAAALDGQRIPEGVDRAAAARQLGFLTERDWRWGEKIRTVEILAELVGWLDGLYELDRSTAPDPGEFRIGIQRLLLELFLRSHDRAFVHHALGAPDAPLHRSDDFDESFATLGLTAEAAPVIAAIDGRATAAEISRRVPPDPFSVERLLAALATLGLVHPEYAIETPPAIRKGRVRAPVAPVPEIPAPSRRTARSRREQRAEEPEEAVVETAEEVEAVREIEEVAEAGGSEVAHEGPELELDEFEEVEEAEEGEDLEEDEELEQPLELEAVPEFEVPGEPEGRPAVHPAEVPPAPALVQPDVEPAERMSEPPRFELPPADLSEPDPVLTGWDRQAPEAMDQPLSLPEPPELARPGRPGLTGVWLLVVLGAAVAALLVFRTREGATPPIATPATAPVASPVAAESLATATASSDSPRPVETLPPRPVVTAAIAGPIASPPEATAASAPPAAPPTAIPQAAAAPSPAFEPAPDPAAAGTAPRGRNGWVARARADAGRVRSDPEARFTIQLELVCEIPSVAEAFDFDRGGAMWLSTADHRGRACFRVFWGRYATLEEARSAKSTVPRFFFTPTNDPVVVGIERALLP